MKTAERRDWKAVAEDLEVTLDDFIARLPLAEQKKIREGADRLIKQERLIREDVEQLKKNPKESD